MKEKKISQKNEFILRYGREMSLKLKKDIDYNVSPNAITDKKIKEWNKIINMKDHNSRGSGSIGLSCSQLQTIREQTTISSTAREKKMIKQNSRQKKRKNTTKLNLNLFQLTKMRERFMTNYSPIPGREMSIIGSQIDSRMS